MPHIHTLMCGQGKNRKCPAENNKNIGYNVEFHEWEVDGTTNRRILELERT